MLRLISLLVCGLAISSFGGGVSNPGGGGPSVIIQSQADPDDVPSIEAKEFIGSSEYGTGVAGDARGTGAVDLVQVHTAADLVPSGKYSFTVGLGSKASGDHSMAIGQGATAFGDYAVALGGQGVYAVGDGSTAFGVSSITAGRYSFAFNDGYAFGENSGALGFCAASGRYSIASGYLASCEQVLYGTLASGVITVSSNAVSGAAQAPTSIWRVGDGLRLLDAGTFATVYAGTITAIDGTTVTVSGGAPDGSYYVTLSDASAPAYQTAHAGNMFASAGDGQEHEWTLQTATSDDTATRLVANNAATGNLTPNTFNQIRIIEGQLRAFMVDCVGLKDDGTSLHKVLSGAIKNVAGTVSLVGSVATVASQVDAGASGWVLDVTADDTDKLLAVTVTGAAASNIRWLAHVQSTEVAWFPPAI